MKVKSPSHCWRLFVASVVSEPEVLASEPPVIVSCPNPNGDASPFPLEARFNRPSCSSTPPENVLSPPSVSAPTPLLTKAWVPAKTALTTPLRPSKEEALAVNVPFFTSPPANVITPAVVWLPPDRFSVPPEMVIEPLVESVSWAAANWSSPATTWVPPS